MNWSHRSGNQSETKTQKKPVWIWRICLFCRSKKFSATCLPEDRIRSRAVLRRWNFVIKANLLDDSFDKQSGKEEQFSEEEQFGEVISEESSDDSFFAPNNEEDVQEFQKYKDDQTSTEDRFKEGIDQYIWTDFEYPALRFLVKFYLQARRIHLFSDRTFWFLSLAHVLTSCLKAIAKC